MSKLLGMMNALRGILPNVGGPRTEVRRLYMSIFNSIALYGAPIWAEEVLGNPTVTKAILRIQKMLAIRICCGYRTMALQAAFVLARTPPVTIVIRKFLDAWEEQLRLPEHENQRVVSSFLPVFGIWLKSAERVTFRTTQILSGHGCFAKYLCRIGKEESENCFHSWDAHRSTILGILGGCRDVGEVVQAALMSKSHWEAFTTFCEK
ncbi:uncharacterized protein LOC108625065, partial [Ceratina calcarata]|uniref:Uncharacterized protein LOC108625065 n=1 Tax=Ceratina calcarata TaxID=156304 RepID=A0AAJ7IZJ0_9HYME